MLLLPLAVHGASINAPHPRARSRMERVVANDNIRQAGTLRGRELRLRLDARVGMWRPDGEDAAGAAVPAFSEARKTPCRIPGPLVRVPIGTEIVMMVKNSVPGTVLTMHGLVSRPRPPGPTPESVDNCFGRLTGSALPAGCAGHLLYWGTTTGRVFRFRTGKDAQLSGAIVVDEPGEPRRRDRILVIGMWSDTTPSGPARCRPGPTAARGERPLVAARLTPGLHRRGQRALARDQRLRRGASDAPARVLLPRGRWSGSG